MIFSGSQLIFSTHCDVRAVVCRKISMLSSVILLNSGALKRAFFAGMAAMAICFSPVSVSANPAFAPTTQEALSAAVADENWSLAIALVDRLIVEQGADRDLLDYRARLERLNTAALLSAAEADTGGGAGGMSVIPGPNAPDAIALEREQQRQAQLAAREARLADRAARREQRNEERILRAESRYLRALERESLARTNAINFNNSRRCASAYCGRPRYGFYHDRFFEDRHYYSPHRVQPRQPVIHHAPPVRTLRPANY